MNSTDQRPMDLKPEKSIYSGPEVIKVPVRYGSEGKKVPLLYGPKLKNPFTL
jgi:hypothetical protein